MDDLIPKLCEKCREPLGSHPGDVNGVNGHYVCFYCSQGKIEQILNISLPTAKKKEEKGGGGWTACARGEY